MVWIISVKCELHVVDTATCFVRSYYHLFVSYFCFNYFLPIHKIWPQMYPLELYPGPMISPATTTILDPSWAPEARSETLRTPQNVPAWTVSWPHDPARLAMRCLAGFGLVMMMMMVLLMSVTLEKTVTISNWLPQSLLMVHQRIKRTAHHDSVRRVHSLDLQRIVHRDYFLNLGVTLYEWNVLHEQKKSTI